MAEADAPPAPSRRGLPGPIRGALWMTASAAFLAAMTALIRHTAQSVHPFEVGFFRSFFGLVFMLPWLFGAGLSVLKTSRHDLYIGRGLIGLIALLTWFYAVGNMPVADATALFFASTLFATVLAVFVLGEKVGPRRWAATAAGFLGVLVVLQPGAVELNLVSIVALASAAGVGFNLTIVKVLSRTEPVNVIVTYMTLVLTPLSLIPALFVWTWPDWQTLGWMFVLAGCGTAGHQCMTRAFRAADSSAVLPFTYCQLPFVAAIGFTAFGEVPEATTWIGGAIIAASSVYIAQRESRLARRARG